jgi:CheY-like chemotaxis protein
MQKQHRISIEPFPAASPHASPHKGARLLVIDDDALGIRVLSAILRDDGHEVIEATEPHEAVGRIRADGSIDAIVVNANMHGSGAVGLVDRLAIARPGVCLIVVTSHDEEYPDSVEVVRRPFRAAELAVAIKAALARCG